MARFEFSRFEFRIKLFSVALVDLLIGLTCYKFSFYLRSLTGFGIFRDILPNFRFLQVPHYTVFLGLSQLALLYFLSFYDTNYIHRPRRSLLNLAKVVSLQILLLIAYYFFRQDTSLAYPRSIFPVYGALNLVSLYLWRLIIHKVFFRRAPKHRVLVVGASKEVKDLIKEIERLPGRVLEVTGVVSGPTDRDAHTFMGYPILGSHEDVVRIAERHDIKEVILAPSPTWQEEVVNEFIGAPELGVRVSILPSPYEILLGRISHLRVHDIPLIEILKEPDSPMSKAFKRVFDVLLATVCLLLTAPVVILVGLLLLVTSGRPILFAQTRMGENGVLFTIYKFRTMVKDAETKTGPVWCGRHDPRVTRLGGWLRRTRLDEIPQLYNILKGNMSFVGPRPERPYFVERFERRIPAYHERLKVKPGLTGLAQVNGAYDTTPENKLKYDLAYIYNKSLWLDLRILMETIKVVLAGGGAPLREENSDLEMLETAEGHRSNPQDADGRGGI
ncbi:sugar transferase [bacterium]|nr:sugar transferase [candidate division CSSED10-310 bacterium]